MMLPEVARAPLTAHRKHTAAQGWGEYVMHRPFIPSPNLNEYEKRLMLLAAHLETVDERHRKRNEPTYSQALYYHHCGTPACAMGHGVALFQRQLQDRAFAQYIGIEGYLAGRWRDVNVWLELFGTTGCGHAQTAKEAAAYIKRFVLEGRHPMHKVQA